MTVFTKRMVMLAVLFTGGIARLFAQGSGVNFVDPRLIVNGPSNLAGSKVFNWSQAPTNTTPWGRPIDSTYFEVPLVKAYDTLGVNPLLNGTAGYPSLNKKFALILRGGGISFSQKAKYCQDAGALGVIIVNHKNGGTIGMAPTTPFSTGTTIPVLMISAEDGMPLNEALKSGTDLTVNLSAWGYGKTNDLGFIDASGATPHGFCIPVTQINAAAGTPRAYNFYNGSFLANFGSGTQTGIKVKQTLTFTPTGGSAAQVWADSVSDASFPQLDSVHEYLSLNTKRLNFATTGSLAMQYTATADLTDENPTDNSMMQTMYVTDSIFCKSRWNPNRGMPVVTSSLRFAADQPLIWGPMFYVSKGGYRAHRAQLAISGDSDRLFETTEAAAVIVYLFKWTDMNTDGLVNGDELAIEATGFKSSFAPSDSSSKPFMVDLVNARTNRLIPRVQDNSWYFLAAELENHLGLGADNDINFFTRNLMSGIADTVGAKREYWAPNTSENLFSPNYPISADTLSNISFFNKSITRAEQVVYKSLTGLVPAVALHLSKTIPTSIESNQASPFTKLEVFPVPANDKLNVNIGITSSATVAVSVINNIGQSVYYKVNRGFNGGAVSISTSSLPAGTYYLVVATDKGSEVRPFSVIHN